MSLTLTKIAETTHTLTLGWTPPAGIEWYLAYAAGERVTNAAPTLKDGKPRTSIRFDKTRAPFEVIAITRDSVGVVNVLVGKHPPLPEPEPTPEPPPPGAIVIDGFDDLDGLWAPEWTSPAREVVRPDGGGITVDADGNWRFVVTHDMQTHPWGSKHILARALVTDVAQHPHMISRFRARFPKAGNPDGFMKKWHACTFWEIGHTQISSGHNIKVDGSQAVPIMYSLVSRAPWGASVNDFDIHEIGPVQWDHEYDFVEEVTYSTGADGRYKLTADGRVVVDRAGPTMGPNDEPYGPQFGHYSTWEPAYPYTNEVIFGPITISLGG